MLPGRLLTSERCCDLTGHELLRRFMTDFNAFRTLAEGCDATGGLVPVYRDALLDLSTPVAAFARLRRDPFAFLLESAPAGGETWARYTYLGTEPRGAWRLRDGVVEDWSPEKGWHNARKPTDPIEDLQVIVEDMCPVHVDDVAPFWSGAVGYFGYDVVRCIEDLPHAPPRRRCRQVRNAGGRWPGEWGRPLLGVRRAHATRKRGMGAPLRTMRQRALPAYGSRGDRGDHRP